MNPEETNDLAYSLSLLRNLLDHDALPNFSTWSLEDSDWGGRIGMRIERLHRIGGAIAWAIGDEIAENARRFGTLRACRIAGAAMGVSDKWAMQHLKVARTFPPETRIAGVKWQLYRVCARSKNPQATLYQALANGWDARRVQAELKKQADGSGSSTEGSDAP